MTNLKPFVVVRSLAVPDPATAPAFPAPHGSTHGHQKVLGLALCQKLCPSSASSLGDDRHAPRLIGFHQKEYCLYLQEHASAVIGSPSLSWYHVGPLLRYKFVCSQPH